MTNQAMLAINLGLHSVKVDYVKTDSLENYHIYVSCTAESTTCYKCEKIITKSHGQCKETVIEHLPIFDQRVFIHVKWPRFLCTNCDKKTTTSFRPDWLNKTGELTVPYENYCLKMLINSTIKDVSAKIDTTEDILEGILNRKINTIVNWSNISLKVMGIDEIALRKGHSQYLTIISDLSDPKNIQLLTVLEGRTKEDVLPFLKSIPEKKLESLEEITVDMGGSFLSAVKELIGDPERFNKVVVIDRFHVAQLIGNKVDKERKKITKELKEEFENDLEKLELLKDTMWPFRHHLNDLNENENERLNNLFKLAPSLKVCYELREELYKIFEKKISKNEAKEKINEWSLKAGKYETKGFNPFTSFIDTYKNYEENILNYFNHRVSSGPVEGLNNKIKVVKRRGFGFRNILNFTKRLFLDINYKPILLPSN